MLRQPNHTTEKNTPAVDFYLPNFCSWQGLGSLTSISVLVALFITLIRWQANQSFLLELLLITIFLFWVSFSCAVTLCVSRRWLVILSRHVAIALTYLLILSITVLISSLAWRVNEELLATHIFQSTTREFFIINNFAVAAVVTTVILHYLSVLHRWRLRVESEARANMQALVSRIRPHFLFNTMNTIAELTRTDGEAAESAIVDLAELLRFTMHQSDQWVTLEQELDICRTYIRVEQLRMRERLQVNWQLDDHLMHCQVPLLCLQPLIENAVKHGAEYMIDQRAINVAVSQVNDQILCARIENPFDENAQSISPSGQRLALNNIRERLQLSYGKQATFTTVAEKDWFVVELMLPLEPRDK